MADKSRKRDTNARRIPAAAKVAAPLAVFATLGAVSVGVVTASPEHQQDVTVSQASIADTLAEREQQVSRSAPRITDRVTPAERRAAKLEAAREAAREARERALAKERAGAAAAIAGADSRLWTTAELNLWDSSFEWATLLGTVDEGERVLVTGREARGRSEIVLGGKSRWVSSDYLSAEKPEPEPSIGNANCTNGSSVPSGVSPNIKKVHAAVCANFPEITSYGTFRSDGEHAQGIAIDIMVSGDRGWQVAEFIRANYGALGVSYVIYSQRIWSVDRAGEGWRGMEDRGSITANHYDHVHVTTD